jgi:hypothetical protein
MPRRDEAGPCGCVSVVLLGAALFVAGLAVEGYNEYRSVCVRGPALKRPQTAASIAEQALAVPRYHTPTPYSTCGVLRPRPTSCTSAEHLQICNARPPRPWSLTSRPPFVPRQVATLRTIQMGRQYLKESPCSPDPALGNQLVHVRCARVRA